MVVIALAILAHIIRLSLALVKCVAWRLGGVRRVQAVSCVTTPAAAAAFGGAAGISPREIDAICCVLASEKWHGRKMAAGQGSRDASGVRVGTPHFPFGVSADQGKRPYMEDRWLVNAPQGCAWAAVAAASGQSAQGPDHGPTRRRGHSVHHVRRIRWTRRVSCFTVRPVGAAGSRARGAAAERPPPVVPLLLPGSASTIFRTPCFRTLGCSRALPMRCRVRFSAWIERCAAASRGRSGASSPRAYHGACSSWTSPGAVGFRTAPLQSSHSQSEIAFSWRTVRPAQANPNPPSPHACLRTRKPQPGTLAASSSTGTGR